MADNSELPVASGNETFANDDIAGVKYPRQKVTWGPDGTANDTDVATGKPLPVQLRGSDGTDRSNLLPVSMADGGSVTLGAKADAASAATDTTAISIMSVLKQISKSVQGLLTLKWATPSAWADAFSTATLNSISSTYAILSDLAISNDTALNKLCDVSIALASLTTPNSPALNVSIHLIPLNKDGSTYGDGRFGTAAAGPPSYPPVGTIPLITNVTQAQNGTATGIIIPPGSFKFLLCNNAGVAFAASGNTCQYRAYN